MKKSDIRAALAAALAGSLIALAGGSQAATIVINNINAAGVGFNDPTPAPPVGGNPGTTIGAQRLNAFTYAANIWGATLTSSIPIVINAQMTALTCSASSAVLGSAGATNIFANFTNAPHANTWYSYALANKLSNSYLGTANAAQISANFNVNLGQANCLPGQGWYLGYDNNHGTLIDFITVLLHEMGHGLGFQTFTNGQSGAFNGSFPSIWDWYLYSAAAGDVWANLTAAQRAASSISVDGLVWSGSLVNTAAPSVLLVGTPGVQISGSNAGPTAGLHAAGEASFGPILTTSLVSGTLMPVVEQTAGAGVGCETFTRSNAAAAKGNIVLIDRGVCGFAVKVKNAQNAGAIGVIIGNNVAGAPPGMGGTDPTITIPSASVTQDDANALKLRLKTISRTGSGVTAALGRFGTQLSGADLLGRVKLYAPNPFQSGSSVSHYDTTATRNLLMEPAINGDLTHSVTLPEDLTFTLLQEIGW